VLNQTTVTSSSSDSDSDLLRRGSSVQKKEATTAPIHQQARPSSPEKEEEERITLSPFSDSSALQPSQDPKQSQPTKTATADSNAWYLHQCTVEFGEELLALRAANDFRPGVSEALIVRALEMTGKSLV